MMWAPSLFAGCVRAQAPPARPCAASSAMDARSVRCEPAAGRGAKSRLAAAASKRSRASPACTVRGGGGIGGGCGCHTGQRQPRHRGSGRGGAGGADGSGTGIRACTRAAGESSAAATSLVRWLRVRRHMGLVAASLTAMDDAVAAAVGVPADTTANTSRTRACARRGRLPAGDSGGVGSATTTASNRSARRSAAVRAAASAAAAVAVAAACPLPPAALRARQQQQQMRRHSGKHRAYRQKGQAGQQQRCAQ